MLVLVAGVALAGAYLALNPPPVAELALPQGRRATHRWEWAVPLGVVVALFAGFLVAQAAAMWGGHDYLERTTGLTYAEYVHQGFGQLTVATLLTLVVVGRTMRRASRATPRDRLLLRLLLGPLCVLTLAVVASALYRMSLYQEAFGFTLLRLSSTSSRAGSGSSSCSCSPPASSCPRRWLPRAVLVSAAVFALGLAAINPDAWVAGRNLDRYDAGQPLDTLTCAPCPPTPPRSSDRLPATRPRASWATAPPAGWTMPT